MHQIVILDLWNNNEFFFFFFNQTILNLYTRIRKYNIINDTIEARILIKMKPPSIYCINKQIFHRMSYRMRRMIYNLKYIRQRTRWIHVLVTSRA